jgi:hypothetical protein
MTGTAAQQQQQQQAAAAAAGDRDGLQGVDEEQRIHLMHTALRAGQLQPTMATTNAALMATNLLHEIDQAVQVS